MNGLSYVIECNYSGNAARLGRDGVLHDESNGSRISTLIGCGSEVAARESAFFSFFGSRPKVTWIDEKRIRMSNGRTELVLERPEVRRLANVPEVQELAGRWIPETAIRLIGNGGFSGSGFQAPGALDIAGDSLIYTGCRGARFNFRYTPEGRINTVRASPPLQCDSDGPNLTFLRVLESGPLVERIAGEGIAMRAGVEVITLRRARQFRQPVQDPEPRRTSRSDGKGIQTGASIDRSSVLGRWQVQSIDGRPPAGRFPLLMQIRPQNLVLTSQCIRMAWTYELAESGTIATRPANPGMVCARPDTLDESASRKVLDQAQHVAAIGNARLLFGGPRGDLILSALAKE